MQSSRDGPIARIPLDEPQGDWTEHYFPLARSKAVDARVEPVPAGVVLAVKIPADATRAETFRLLNTAAHLVDEAKAGQTTQQEASLNAEQYVGEWWSAR